LGPDMACNCNMSFSRSISEEARAISQIPDHSGRLVDRANRAYRGRATHNKLEGGRPCCSV
jgi:hypothetical protein